MGFNSGFKGLNLLKNVQLQTRIPGTQCDQSSPLLNILCYSISKSDGIKKTALPHIIINYINTCLQPTTLSCIQRH